MQILVTGGAGFLGSHLVERLLREGRRVIALDDLSTGRVDNLAPLLGRPDFTLLRQDVRQPFRVAVDRIYHLACPASPTAYQADPVGTTMTCVQGTLNALRLAQQQGARLLQASTSEVYGDPAVHPQTEDYHGDVNPIGPRACYDEGKRCAETLCFAYHRTLGTAIRVARIFNTYGPRMQPGDGRVVSTFVTQALRGEPLTVHGRGEQTRSLCYVDDLMEALQRLMTGSAEGPINLGNPDEHTVLDIAETVLRLTRSRSRIVFTPLPADDPKRRRPDISRARRLLGWQPAVTLEDGLRETIGWFRHALGQGAQRLVA